MSANQIITVITGVLEGGGLAVFIYYLVRGLRTKISALQGTIEAQKQTLDVMDKRIAETEKIGEIYRKLISDLPADIDNYRKIVSSTKDDMIQELQKANQLKDEQLKESAQLKLKEIELVEQSLAAIPKLQGELAKTVKELQTRIRSVDLLMHISPARTGLLPILSDWTDIQTHYPHNWALSYYLRAFCEHSQTSAAKTPQTEKAKDEGMVTESESETR